MAAPLGRTATGFITVTNPLPLEAAFTASVEAAGAAGLGGSAPPSAHATGSRSASGSGRLWAGAERFVVSPAAFTLAPYASADVTVRPCSGSSVYAARVAAAAACPTPGPPAPSQALSWPTTLLAACRSSTGQAAWASTSARP
jgi:hypothetical protein